MKKRVSIFWFRRDLRLFDNHGLWHALSGPDPVLPLFIFDKNILSTLEPHDQRVNFIHRAVFHLHEQLKSLGSSILVVHDDPLSAIKKILSEWDVAGVYTNRDYEPYAVRRDNEVEIFLRSKGIQFRLHKDQVVFDTSEVVKADGAPYTVFTPYSNAWKRRLHIEKIESYPSEDLFARLYPMQPATFPPLAEIGFRETGLAVTRAAPDDEVISNYYKTRDFPALNGTTRMGVHLRFGTTSVRQLVKKAQLLNETFLNELIWREFFMCILYHFPRVVTASFREQYDRIQWRNNEHEFEAWCNGETGYPLVDAGMRELNNTGFMHNRVRMVVASFLTKHLLIDWRWGEAYFAEKLLDYELASNNGNWQWAAGTGCDAAPYFRIFNPMTQAKKFDPENEYIRKWLGNDYHLQPIVDHRLARERALAAYKKALH